MMRNCCASGCGVPMCKACSELTGLVGGTLCYKNECGELFKIKVLSCDDGNLISIGSDGGLVVRPEDIKEACPETVTSISGLENGALTYVDEAGAETQVRILAQETTNLIETAADGGLLLNCEGITECVTDLIKANADTLDDNGDGSLTHVSTAGIETTFTAPKSQLTTNAQFLVHDNGVDGPQMIDVCALVGENCSDSVDLNPLTGGFTHTAINGDSVPYAPPLSTITDNGDGTYTHNDGLDRLTVIEPASSSVSVVGSTIVHNSGLPGAEDVEIDVCQLVQDNCPVSVTINEETGGFTFTDNAGDDTSYTPPTSTISDNGDGTFTHTDGLNEPTVVQMPVSSLSAVGSTLVHNDGIGGEQMIDVCQLVSESCQDSLSVDNENGSFTYTDVNGDVQIFTAPRSTITLNGDGSFTHDDGLDGVQTVQVCDLLAASTCKDTITVDAANGTFTHTNVAGEDVLVTMPRTTVTEEGPIITIDNGVDSPATSINICDIVRENCSDRIDVAEDGASFVHVSVDNVSTPFNPPRSTVTANPDGSYTHDDGVGNLSVISPPASVLTVDNAIITHSSGLPGEAPQVIDVCALVADNCNSAL